MRVSNAQTEDPHPAFGHLLPEGEGLCNPLFLMAKIVGIRQKCDSIGKRGIGTIAFTHFLLIYGRSTISVGPSPLTQTII